MAAPSDPFLGGGGTGTRGAGVHPGAGTYGKSGGAHPFGLMVFVVVPWVLFAVVLTMFTYVYYHHPAVCWGLLAFAAACSTLTCMSSYRDGPPQTSYAALGVLCLFALVFAALTGLYNYEKHMAPFWTYDESREYTNVLPSEPAASFLDAGKIQFAQSARVDTTESVGYKHGDTYCVAPIKDANSGSRVEFWAVCVNQCGGRRDFRCDDSGDPNARGAVTLNDHGNFLPSQMKYFERAVKEAEASFDLVSASEPMFVRWTADPDTYQKNMFDSGTGHFVFFLVLYVFFNGVLAMQANYLVRK